MSDLEVLLNSEPSITLKILQVANSAAVAGAASQGATSLKDAITRLDNRKVGAIAQ
jgi:HD-like signal output (HDOD) protein